MADTREVAAQFLEAFNAHDKEGMRRLNADNTVFEGPGDVRLEGRDAATGYAMSWLNAFQDARIELHNEIVAGEWVVQEFTFHGTHTAVLSGPAGDIPPTRRELHGRAVQVIKVENGEVADTHLYFDQVQVMTQLGLMPEPAAAS